VQPALSRIVTLSTRAPPSDDASEDDRALLRPASTEAPFWITATLSARDAVGSNSVSYACVIAAVSGEGVVVAVVGGPPDCVVTMTGDAGEPGGADDVIPLGARSFG
jgi:hypothetical protein